MAEYQTEERPDREIWFITITIERHDIFFGWGKLHYNCLYDRTNKIVLKDGLPDDNLEIIEELERSITNPPKYETVRCLPLSKEQIEALDELFAKARIVAERQEKVRSLLAQYELERMEVEKEYKEIRQIISDIRCRLIKLEGEEHGPYYPCSENEES